MAVADDAAPSQGPLPVQPSVAPSTTRRLFKLTQLISPASNQLTGLGHLALAGTLLLGSLTLNVWMFAFAQSQEQDWLNFERVEKTLEESQAAVANLQATPAERARLVDQFMLIQARTVTHAKVMGLFYKLNFIALGTVGLTTGIASISLFFISKVGWEQGNNALINVFIVSSGLVIFHSNMIFVFKFQENIQLNGQLYSEYTRLYNEMLSYWAIQPTSSTSPSPAEWIMATDQQLTRLGKISLDFEASRIDQLKQPVEAFVGGGPNGGDF
ncbi:MAG: hypothetical protein ACFCVD_23670 [Nodosilinea sp.]